MKQCFNGLTFPPLCWSALQIHKTCDPSVNSRTPVHDIMDCHVTRQYTVRDIKDIRELWVPRTELTRQYRKVTRLPATEYSYYKRFTNHSWLIFMPSISTELDIFVWISTVTIVIKLSRWFAYRPSVPAFTVFSTIVTGMHRCVWSYMSGAMAWYLHSSLELVQYILEPSCITRLLQSYNRNTFWAITSIRILQVPCNV